MILLGSDQRSLGNLVDFAARSLLFVLARLIGRKFDRTASLFHRSQRALRHAVHLEGQLGGEFTLDRKSVV